MYVADNGFHRIRKVSTATGIISTVAGTGAAGYSGDGGAATSAALNYPHAVVVDSSGTIYIADSSNHRIRMVTASPTETPTTIPTANPSLIPTIIPTFEPSLMPTSYPSNFPSLAPSDQPSYLPTSAPSYSSEPTPSPTLLPTSLPTINPSNAPSAVDIITTIAGTGTASYSGDGGQATSATLNDPRGVAVDSSGSESYYYISLR